MMYLVIEISAFIILAGFLGFLFGWLLKSAVKRKKWEQLENTYKINMASQRQTVSALEKEIQKKSERIESILEKLEKNKN
jgi:Tfp pilus assembly protein PilO